MSQSLFAFFVASTTTAILVLIAIDILNCQLLVFPLTTRPVIRDKISEFLLVLKITVISAGGSALLLWQETYPHCLFMLIAWVSLMASVGYLLHNTPSPPKPDVRVKAPQTSRKTKSSKKKVPSP